MKRTYTLIKFLTCFIFINSYCQESELIYNREQPGKKILIGLDLTKNFYHIASGSHGFTVEPVFKFIPGPHAPVLTLALGYSKFTKDLLLNNLNFYVNKGFYTILGIETRLKTLKRVKFTGGLNMVIMSYSETGKIIFKNDYFEDGVYDFRRKNKFGFGTELTGNLYIPLSEKINFCVQAKIGALLTPYTDIPTVNGETMYPPYIQGMGDSESLLSASLNLKIFYKIK